MRDNITQLSTFTNAVTEATAAGGTTPAEYDRILQAWRDFAETTNTATGPVDELAEAVIEGAPEDRVRDLMTCAYALDVDPMKRATVAQTVAGRVLAALRESYETVAADNYETARKAFDTTATRFAKALDTIDPDTPSDQLLTATAAQRSAWAEIPPLADELDTRLLALAATARLAGTDSTPDGLLAFAVTPGEKDDRRAIWQAWEDDTPRGGRWTALARTGQKITAPALADWQHYRRPAPLETHTVAVGNGQYVNVTIDPEKGEDPATVAQAERSRRRAALVSA